MWLPFVIYMQTPPDARRWGSVSYSNATIRNIAIQFVAAAVHMFVLFVCMHAPTPFTAEFTMQTSFPYKATTSFSFGPF